MLPASADHCQPPRTENRHATPVPLLAEGVGTLVDAPIADRRAVWPAERIWLLADCAFGRTHRTQVAKAQRPDRLTCPSKHMGEMRCPIKPRLLTSGFRSLSVRSGREGRIMRDGQFSSLFSPIRTGECSGSRFPSTMICVSGDGATSCPFGSIRLRSLRRSVVFGSERFSSGISTACR